MKLLRARIRNYGAFDDMELNFSTDLNRNVTLLRGDSGKTTLLNAIEWGLLGGALEQRVYSIQPFDGEDGRTTVVEVDFELPRAAAESRAYQVVRSASWREQNGVWEARLTNTEWFDLANGRSPLEGIEGRTWRRNVGRQVLFLYGAQLSSFVEGTGQGVNAVADSLERLAGGLGESSRVSDRMNALFRQMASAGARQTASVSKVWITSEFGIVVSGDDGSVRCASVLPWGLKQVLAISFVLAVMGRTECVFIDDLLATLDAELAARTLRRVSQEIRQLVLAVNPRHSDVDELFDILVGRSNTFTLAADYPTQLTHDPGKMHGFLACDCNHRAHCHICDRRY